MKKLVKLMLVICLLVAMQFLILIFVNVVNDMGMSIQSSLLIVGLNLLLFIATLRYFYEEQFRILSSMNFLKTRYHLTSTLYDLLKKTALEEDSHMVYDLILKAAASSIPGADFGTIILFKEHTSIFEASFGFDHAFLESINLVIEDTALYKLTEGKMDHAIIVSNILNINDSLKNQSVIERLTIAGTDTIKSTITAPINVGEEIIGSINLDSKKANNFEKGDLEMIEIFAYEVGKFVQLNRVNELNRKMSRYDELTDIYNRAYCKILMKDLLLKETPFNLVSADLNKLKVINDYYGHDQGDKFILGFVKVVKQFVKEDVIFSRYGGDEFILVFPNTESEGVELLLQKITAFLDIHPIENVTEDIFISFSYGIASYPSETTQYEEILKLADKRMYEAKNRSNNPLQSA